MRGHGLMNPAAMKMLPLPLPPSGGDRQPFVSAAENPLARPTFAAGSGNNNEMGSQVAVASTVENFAGGAMTAGGQAGGSVATLPGGARVSADISTNSLIIYAQSNAHKLYEKLIESLDQRRPQVLIEAKIIAIDTSDNYSLGIEVSAGTGGGVDRAFSFSSFGLSEVDPTTGASSLTPRPGLQRYSRGSRDRRRRGPGPIQPSPSTRASLAENPSQR